VIQSATGDKQAQLITTLADLPDALAASGLGSPSIIVIGDVVRCASNNTSWEPLTHIDAIGRAGHSAC